MISGLLRATHAPVWVVFAVIFGLYICTTGWWMINGYTRELFGSPLPHMGRIHKVVYNFNRPSRQERRSPHGDQRHLKRVAGAVNRATPDGATVYFTPWKRWQRALRNNSIIVAWLLISCGMAIDPRNTVRAVTLILLFGGIGLIVLFTLAEARARLLEPSRLPAGHRPDQTGEADTGGRHYNPRLALQA